MQSPNITRNQPIHIPSLWLWVAWSAVLSAAILNSYPLLFLACAFGTCVFGFSIWRVIRGGEAFRFFLISSLACGAWVSAGFIQSGISAMRLGIEDFPSLFSEFSTRINVTHYGLATAYLYAFILACCYLSRLKLVRRCEEQYEHFVIQCLRSAPASTWTTALAFLSVVLSVVAVRGLFTIRGVSEQYQSSEGGITWWYAAVTYLLAIMPLLISQVVAHMRSWIKPAAIVTAFGIATSLYYATLEGRRAVLILLLSSIFSYVVIQVPAYTFSRSQSTRILILVVTGVILWPIFFNLLSFINFIRFESEAAMSPLELSSRFSNFLESASLLQEASDKAQENLSFRPLVLWPLAAAIKLSLTNANQEYLLFQDIWNSFLNALPAFLIGSKSSLLLQENLLYKYFPFSDVDTADSPYLYSYASFWLFGLAIYPLAMILAYSLYLRFVVVMQSMSSTSPLPALLSLPPLIPFAIFSYGEMATTSLLRMYIMPSFAIIVVCSTISLLPHRRGSNRIHSNEL